MKSNSLKHHLSRVLSIFIIFLLAACISINIILYGSYDINPFYDEASVNEAIPDSTTDDGYDPDGYDPDGYNFDTFIFSYFIDHNLIDAQILKTCAKTMSLIIKDFIPVLSSFPDFLFVVLLFYILFIIKTLQDDRTLINLKVRLND